MSRAQAGKLLNFLYVHNPFFLISAGLFVYGLKLMFRPGNAFFMYQQGSVAYIEPWGLRASLAGITALMAITAVMIVRLGRVWEDARSLVLIVLLMLFAMTVSMDELLNLLADRGNSSGHLTLMFALMTTFSIGCVEGLLRGLRLQLPCCYRIPLHLTLLVMIIWPAMLLPDVMSATAQQIQTRIAAFPLACGLILLTLLPAVWKGSERLKESHSPWTWPLYPWTAFGFLFLAICMRSYSLTMSFDVLQSSGHYWDTSFGTWQLTPVFMAALILLMETGIKEQREELQNFCLLVAPALLLMAAPWIVPWSGSTGFRTTTNQLLSQMWSPVYCTLLGLILFYGRARLKGIPGAQWGLIAMVILSTAIHADSFRNHGNQVFRIDLTSIPLLGFALFDFVVSLRQKTASRVFLSSLLLVAILHQHLTPDFMTSWLATLTCAHLILLIGMVIAILDRTEFARALKELAAPVYVLTAMISSAVLFRELDVVAASGYILGMICFAAIVGRLINWKALLTAAKFLSAACGVILAVVGIQFVASMKLPKGSRQLILGLLSFLTAVGISVWKAGFGRRLKLHRIRKQRQRQQAAGIALSP